MMGTSGDLTYHCPSTMADGSDTHPKKMCHKQGNVFATHIPPEVFVQLESGINCGKDIMLQEEEEWGPWDSRKTERRECAIQYILAKINEQEIPVMCDSGSDLTLTTTEYCKLRKLPIIPFEMHVGNVSSTAAKVVGLVKLKVTIAKYVYSIFAPVLQTSGRNPPIILGRDFIVPADMILFPDHVLLPGDIRVPNVPYEDLRGIATYNCLAHPEDAVKEKKNKFLPVTYVGKPRMLKPGETMVMDLKMLRPYIKITGRQFKDGITTVMMGCSNDEKDGYKLKIINEGEETKMLKHGRLIGKAFRHPFHMKAKKEGWFEDPRRERSRKEKRDVTKIALRQRMQLGNEFKKPTHKFQPLKILKRTEPRDPDPHQDKVDPTEIGEERISFTQHWIQQCKEIVKDDEIANYLANAPGSDLQVFTQVAEANVHTITMEELDTMSFDISAKGAKYMNPGLQLKYQCLLAMKSELAEPDKEPEYSAHSVKIDEDPEADPNSYLHHYDIKDKSESSLGFGFCEVPDMEGFEHVLCKEEDFAKAKIGLENGENPDSKVIVTEAQRKQMLQVLLKYKHVFMSDKNAAPPPIKGYAFKIVMKDESKIIKHKVRRVKYEFMGQLYDLLNKLLKYGLIEYSTSEWASAIVLPLKKDKKTIRLCIDYRDVNTLTKRTCRPLPRIDDIIECFEGANYFSAADAANGFWQVAMDPVTAEMLAFTCPIGHFQWTRMPFGHCDAPGYYQYVLNQIFKEPMQALDPNSHIFQLHGDEEVKKKLRLTHIRSYVDDIPWASPGSWDLHCALTEEVLIRCSENRFTLSLPKSAFGCKKIHFLGNELSVTGKNALFKDVEDMMKLPFPKTKKGMQSYVGTFIYHKKYIPYFSTIAASLHSLTEENFEKKEIPDAAYEAFEHLKTYLLHPKELIYPIEGEMLYVVLFENQWSIAAVLTHVIKGESKPISHATRVLTDAEGRWHSMEREVLALLQAIKTFFPLLAGGHFKVITRRTNLKWLLTSPRVSGRIERWAIELSQFDFEVIKRPTKGVAQAALLSTRYLSPDQAEEVLDKFAPPRPEKELVTKMERLPSLDLSKEQYVLTFDGAAKTKTVLGSAGYIIWKLPEWEIVEAKGVKFDGGTVNTQEYQALICGLKAAKTKNIKQITCFGDSNLVVSQINGFIFVHDPKLQQLHVETTALIKEFECFELFHVARNYNAAADYLAGQVLKISMDFIPREPQLEYMKSIHHLPTWLKQIEMMENTKSDSATNFMWKNQMCFAVTRAQAALSAPEKPEKKERKRIRAPQETPKERQEFQEHLDSFDEQLSALTMQRRDRFKKGQATVPWMRDLIEHLKGNTIPSMDKQSQRIMRESPTRFFLTKDGILVRKGVTKGRAKRGITIQWVVPPSLRDDIMRAYHDEAIAGHLGQDMTYYRIAEHFWWPKLRDTVRHHVRSCLDCQAGKGYPRNKAKRKLNICATHPMQYVSLDFVGPFPESNNGYKYVCVAQDMFTRMVWLFPMVDVTAWETAHIYYHQLLIKHGASAFVRSDRGAQFISNMFQMVVKLFGQKHLATMAYRPQGNGQNERTHGVIFSCVKLFCLDPEQRDWDEYLQQMAFAMNTAYRPDVGETPFYLFHGWDPYFPMEAMLQKNRHAFQEYNQKRWRNKTAREWSYVRKHVEDVMKAKKLKAIAEDKSRGIPITVGDRVWVWVPKVKSGYSKKLAFRWIGPYRVEDITDDGVRVTLRIPAKTGIYPQVHYDRLKKCYDENDRPTTPPEDQESLGHIDFTERLEDLPDPNETIPLMDQEGDLIPVPQEEEEDPDEFEVEAILERRQVGRMNKKYWEYLIKWKGYDDSQNTWEKEENLHCGDLLYDFKKRLRSEGREVALSLEKRN